MGAIQDVRVKIQKTHDATFTEGTVQIQTWQKNEQLGRALKLGGKFWAAALVCVFIPIVHFVLAPLLFLAGPIVAYKILNQTSMILGGQGVCPHCKANLPIIRTENKFPFTDLCTQCRNNVIIEPL